MSGRISHAMQWGGPSVVTDTACSSSLVAIYQGCRALVNRDCNAAIVGGVNAITSPDVSYFESLEAHVADIGRQDVHRARQGPLLESYWTMQVF